MRVELENAIQDIKLMQGIIPICASCKKIRDDSGFWNQLEPYLKKGYNSYLKANNQSKGIKSYSYVVDLLIAYFDKNQ